MVVDQCMKQEIITVPASATVAEAVSLFNAHHVGMLPVLNGEGRLVGIVNLRDLLDLIMPAFVNLIDDFDYVGDFGVLEGKQPSIDLLNQSVMTVMEPPVSVPASSGLLRAFAYLHKHELLDLPIVDDQTRLVGLASRVDVGRALLAGWHLNL
jgi:CBS-domain-containing membrane protein